MSKYECGGGCKTHVIRPSGNLSWCGACFFLEEVLAVEGCGSVAELAVRRDYLRARLSDVLRRSGVADAEDLVAALAE